MIEESCGVCGGDGQIGNSFGLTNKCPSCHGSGRRAAPTGFRDVTKTKPSHFRQPNKSIGPVKPEWPGTYEGARLATEVKDSGHVPDLQRTRLIREIIDYEGSHGLCTQTFLKKVRKQIKVSK